VEPQALKAQQAQLVRPDHRVLRVKLALLALLVQPAQLGQLVQTELMEQLQLLLLARFQQAQPDPVQQLQIQALPAQLYLRFRFHRAPLERLVPLEPMALMVPMVLQALLGHKALQVQREQPDLKVLQVPMAQMVRMVLQP
jgi:hypothetical protein